MVTDLLLDKLSRVKGIEVLDSESFNNILGKIEKMENNIEKAQDCN